MESQILIGSVRPWSALYFIINPLPPYRTVKPSRDNEGGGNLFFTKGWRAVYKYQE